MLSSSREWGNSGRQNVNGRTWSDSRSENALHIAVLTVVATKSSVSPNKKADVWSLVFLCCQFPSQFFILFHSLQVNNLYPLLLSLLLFVGAVWPCRSLCQPGFWNCCCKEPSLEGSWCVCSPEFWWAGRGHSVSHTNRAPSAGDKNC